MMRLYTFSLKYTAEEFSILSKDMAEFQKVFDAYDLVKELAKLSPELKEKLKNIKSVRINAIEFEPAVKKFLEKKETKRNNEVIAES